MGTAHGLQTSCFHDDWPEVEERSVEDSLWDVTGLDSDGRMEGCRLEFDRVALVGADEIVGR